MGRGLGENDAKQLPAMGPGETLSTELLSLGGLLGVHVELGLVQVRSQKGIQNKPWEIFTFDRICA